MPENSATMNIENYGSEALNQIVKKLKTTDESRRRYEYVLWLAKKLPSLSKELRAESCKVKGCISQVYVLGKLVKGKMQWEGYSDALITKGLLALLVEGLKNLTPSEIMKINPEFIKATGLSGSLTPSRANGFLNIFLAMQKQAKDLAVSGGNLSSSS